MEEIIRKLLIEVVMKAVLAKLVATIPFLGFPIIGPIVGMLLGKVFNLIGDELILMIKFKQIDIRVGKEDAAYTESKRVLEHELNKPIRDEAKINEAKEQLKKDFQRLINFNPK